MYAQIIKPFYELPVSVPFSTSYTRLLPSEVSDGQNLQKSVEFKVHDFAEINSAVHASDFNICNLLAVGAYNMLSPFVLEKDSDMTVVDKFSESYAAFTSRVNQSNQNNQNQ